MVASVPGKSSGTWLWPRSSQGHCEEELKRKKKVTTKAIRVPAGKERFLIQSQQVAVCPAGPWVAFWWLWAFPHSLDVCSGRHSLTSCVFRDCIFSILDIKLCKTRHRCALCVKGSPERMYSWKCNTGPGALFMHPKVDIYCSDQSQLLIGFSYSWFPLSVEPFFCVQISLGWQEACPVFVDVV